MPDGYTHERISLTVGSLTTPLVIILYDPATLGWMAGMVISFFITPDLSCTNPRLFIGPKRSFGTGGTRCRSDYYLARLGLFGAPWRWVFDMLAVRVPHRHWLSHSVVGTLIRQLVLFPILIAAWVLGGWLFTTSLLLAWILNDSVHVFVDRLSSYYKRRRRLS